MIPYSLYLHIPFCQHRCAYCDFNTYAGLSHLVDDYVRALCREIELVAEAAGERLPAHTIFFGGGTPSLLSSDQLGEILGAIEHHFTLLGGVEITLEANPGTVTLEKLREMRAMGINRLSMGMQSAHPEELRLLERQHDFYDVMNAVRWAEQAGFEQINLDLIFGLPGQSLAAWQANLGYALQLNPDHLSLYSLILEDGTPMNHWVERGLMAMPDQDIAAEMYAWTMEYLQGVGFVQYEISNWARESSGGEMPVCRHNLQYWLNQPYLGFGAGAHGFAGGYRTANVLGPAAYIQRCLNNPRREFPRSPASANVLAVDRYTEMQETMMMGLRLTQSGVSEARFSARFGVTIAEAFSEELERLLSKGLVEWVEHADGAVLRLTPEGRMFGNQVFMEFV